MKKILASFFILTLLLPLMEFVGLRIEINNLKKAIKNEMLSQFDSSQATTLIFSKQDLSKRNHIVFHTQDNEIEIKGEMYDIISITYSSDSLIFKCYGDYKESELRRKMYAILASLFAQNPIKSETTKSLFLFLKNLIFEKVKPIFFFNLTELFQTYNLEYITDIHEGFFLLDSPPPEL